jgi:hypothetical protein
MPEIGEEVIGDGTDRVQNGHQSNAAGELLRRNRRRMEVPIGMVDDLGAKAEHAQHEEEIFDRLHCRTSALNVTHYQETPYRAAILRASASSLA